jgi:uncharacterized membrane protein
MHSSSTLKNHPNKFNILFGLVVSLIFTMATLYVAYLELSKRVQDTAFQKNINKKGDGIKKINSINSMIISPDNKGPFSK